MTPVTSDSCERAELRALREGMLACSPRQQPRPRDAELQLQQIEWRAQLRQSRRRWLVGSAVAAVVGLLLGVLGTLRQQRSAPATGQPAERQPIDPPRGGQPGPLAAARGEQRYSTSDRPTLIDLGPAIGRILLRAHTRATYITDERTLTLHRGRVVAHIFHQGRGFRVRFGAQTVIVRGTLFGVDAQSGAVRVWHGVVVHTRAADSEARTLKGTERYHDLSETDMAWLDFTPPAAAVLPGKRPAGPKRAAAHRAASGAQDAAEAYQPDPMRQHLLQAQKDLAAGRAVAALQLLEPYEARFPASPLLEEACLLKIRALVALKRFRRIQQLTYMFLKRFPGSTKRAEVELLQRRAAAHLKRTRSR